MADTPEARTDNTELDSLRNLLKNKDEELTTVKKSVNETNDKLILSTDQQLEAREAAVVNAITAAEAEAARAEDEYAAAMAESDFKRAAKAQRSIAATENKIASFNAQKEQINAWRSQWEVQKEELKKQPSQQSRQSNVTDKSAEWIARHPQFNTDPRYQAKVVSAHYAALGEGIPIDTPEYFAFVEEQIGERQRSAVQRTASDDDDEDEEAIEVNLDDEQPIDDPDLDQSTEAIERRAAPKRKTNTMTAAPPSRSVPSQAGGRKDKSVRLSPSEMEAAKFSFPDEYKKNPNEAYTLYARNKEQLKAEGKLH